MGKKFTRAEVSARHAYSRALDKSLRATAKGTGWKAAYGAMFCEKAGWFVDVTPSVHIYEDTTKALIRVKPMAIDPIFWDLVGLPENRDLPLSFRSNGAWTCSVPYYAELDVDEDGNADAVAKRFIAIATELLTEIVSTCSLESFLSKCFNVPSIEGAYLSSVVCTLVVLGRQSEALAICVDASSKGLSGGFSAPGGTFSEMAAAHLRKIEGTVTLH